ncbi:MAG: tetratricopeptide repeat protein [Acidobacteriota bacterium]|nr:tetratricopeptide repeat protein [Acidobacteriota bacterium]
MMRLFTAAIIAAICLGCASAPVRSPDTEQMLPPDVEAISLLGKPLSSPPLAADVQKKREEELALAQRDFDADPSSADAVIWLGRRTAYLGRYREAINIFTDGIRKHPDDARLYRHRGHRYITVRRFRDAIRDLEFASLLVRGKPDEVEPDGQPNARNIPIGSLQSNIFYHLGLAYYLTGDFDHALTAYRRCIELAKNPDRLVSTSHWLYMTLRRLGRVQEAEKVLEPISVDLDVIENIPYHKLLLMYGGDIAPEELVKVDANTTDGAAILYGIGNWYFYNGQPDRAFRLWQRVLDGPQWSAFGSIAAEAEVARRAAGDAGHSFRQTRSTAPK